MCAQIHNVRTCLVWIHYYISVLFHCQLDPARLPKGSDLSPNVTRLKAQLLNILSAIFTSTDVFPM